MDPEIVNQAASQAANSQSGTGLFALAVGAIGSLWATVTGLSVRRNIAAVDQRHSDAIKRIDDLENEVTAFTRNAVTQPAFDAAMNRIEHSLQTYADDMKTEIRQMRQRIDGIADRRGSPRQD